MKNVLFVALIFSSIHVFAQLPSPKVEGRNPALYLNHEVVDGQTFLTLAKAFNLSPNMIATFNQLKLGAKLDGRTAIKIPLTPTNFELVAVPSETNEYLPLYHLVSDEATIASVSNTLNITEDRLKKLNPKENGPLKEGSKIIIGYLKFRKDQLAISTTAIPGTTAANAPAPVAAVISTDTGLNRYRDFDSDQLFEQARRIAFDKKDYNTALQLCRQALGKSPGYSDIKIFAGRLFTWMDQPDSARHYFNDVMQNDATNKDLYLAYTDLEYWNDQYDKALEICEKGLTNTPNSSELVIKKVKILKALKRPAEAQQLLEKLLKTDRSNTEARALLERNKNEILRNKLGVSYEYTYFDKQFSDPWHIGSVDYSRQTKLGSIGGHVWYANRFKSGGLQYELEAYPHISKYLYGYVSVAYSNQVGVFPKYRSGFSLYAILPKSIEAELGLRYLYFSDATIIYTAAISKYYKSWLFTARTYLTPGESNLSQTYNLITRYYYGGADDYLSFTVGRGISPDDKPLAVLLNNKQYENLVTTKASVAFRHQFSKKYVLTIDAGWMNQEYRPQTKGNQLSTGISYQVRF